MILIFFIDNQEAAVFFRAANELIVGESAEIPGRASSVGKSSIRVRGRSTEYADPVRFLVVDRYWQASHCSNKVGKVRRLRQHFVLCSTPLGKVSDRVRLQPKGLFDLDYSTMKVSRRSQRMPEVHHLLVCIRGLIRITQCPVVKACKAQEERFDVGPQERAGGGVEPEGAGMPERPAEG